jgi:hypothetical protein
MRSNTSRERRVQDWVCQVYTAARAAFTVYLGSPTTARNIYDPVASRATVFGRELKQFLDAQYNRVADHLYPPGTP